MGMQLGQDTDSNAPMSEINVTPMVDVMLVLLIIFMVAAPMLRQGVDVELPQTRATPLKNDDEKNILTITVKKEVYLGDVEIPFAQLKQKLTNNLKLKKDKRVFLNADRRLKYEVVVDVMATLQRSGVSSIGLVTNPTGKRPK